MAAKTKGKTKRRYSDAEREAAVAAVQANGGNIHGTAEQLDVPRTSLEHWVKGTTHPEVPKNGQAKKAPLVDVFEGIAYRMLKVADDKADELNAKDAVVAAAVAVDKMQLLRGMPTEIGANVNLHGTLDPDTAKRAAQLLESVTYSVAPTLPPATSPDGPPDPGGAGLLRESGSVGEPTPPDAAQQSTR